VTDKRQKARNKEASRQWRAEQNSAARSRFPLLSEQLEELFEMLNRELAVVQCDHTLRLVQAWAWQRELEFAPIQAWLHDTGGYCDCEALANSEQAWREALRT